MTDCKEHGLTESYESSPGLCRICHARRAYAADRRIGRAAVRLFGPADGVKPHRDKWGTLSFEVRKAELIKQRKIDAAEGLPEDQSTSCTVKELPPELVRIREENAKLYRKADRKVSARRHGFVYVMWNPAWPEYLKIGRSGDPLKRLSDAQTWCPHNGFECRHMAYFEDCISIEAEVHKVLADCRKDGGEWFKMSTHDAIHLLKLMQERN